MFRFQGLVSIIFCLSTEKPCHRYTGLIKCGDCGCIFSCKIRKRDGHLDRSDICSVIDLLERIIEEGEISDANIRLHVNKIIVKEQNGNIDIQIKLNAEFKNYIMIYEDESASADNQSSIASTEKDTLCDNQSVSFMYV